MNFKIFFYCFLVLFISIKSFAQSRDSYLNYLNVQSYTGIPNGTRDESKQINTAINAAITSGRILYFPAGVYKLDSMNGFGDIITPTSSGGSLKMKFDQGAVLLTSSKTLPLIDFKGPFVDVEIEGGYFKSNHDTTNVGNAALLFQGINPNIIRHVKIHGCTFEGFSTSIVGKGVQDFQIYDNVFIAPLGHDNATTTTVPAVFINAVDDSVGDANKNWNVYNNHFDGYSGSASITTLKTGGPMDGAFYGHVSGLLFHDNVTKHFAQEHIKFQPGITYIDSLVTSIYHNNFDCSIPIGSKTPTGSKITSNYAIRAEGQNLSIVDNDIYNSTIGILFYATSAWNYVFHNPVISNNRIRVTKDTALNPTLGILLQGYGNSTRSKLGTINNNTIIIDSTTLKSTFLGISDIFFDSVIIDENHINERNTTKTGGGVQGISLQNSDSVVLGINPMQGVDTQLNASSSSYNYSVKVSSPDNTLIVTQQNTNHGLAYNVQMDSSQFSTQYAVIDSNFQKRTPAWTKNYATKLADSLTNGYRNDAGTTIRIGRWLKHYWSQFYTTATGDNNPSRIVVDSSLDNGFTWSNPRVVIAPSATVAIPSAYVQNDGKTVIMFVNYVEPAASPTKINFYRYKSVDSGGTMVLQDSLYSSNTVYRYSSADRIAKSKATGKLYLPIGEYNSGLTANTIRIWSSTDDGNTWSELSTAISDANNAIMDEPGIFITQKFLPNDTLNAPEAVNVYYTTTNDVMVSQSIDNGSTFGTPYKIGFQSPQSELTLKAIRNETQIIGFYNPLLNHATLQGQQRSQLAMIGSTDGNNWTQLNFMLGMDSSTAWLEPNMFYDSAFKNIIVGVSKFNQLETRSEEQIYTVPLQVANNPIAYPVSTFQIQTNPNTNTGYAFALGNSMLQVRNTSPSSWPAGLFMGTASGGATSFWPWIIAKGSTDGANGLLINSYSGVDNYAAYYTGGLVVNSFNHAGGANSNVPILAGASVNSVKFNFGPTGNLCIHCGLTLATNAIKDSGDLHITDSVIFDKMITGTNSDSVVVRNAITHALHLVAQSSYIGKDSVIIITSGASSTVTNGYNIIRFNPSSTISSYTLTLPTTWHTNNDLLISFGGTLTSGPVVTSLTIVGGAGQTLLQAIVPTTGNAGEIIRYHLISGTIDQRVN